MNFCVGEKDFFSDFGEKMFRIERSMFLKKKEAENLSVYLRKYFDCTGNKNGLLLLAFKCVKSNTFF